MNAQLTTVRDGARASASTPRRSVSERPRVARSAVRIAGPRIRASTTATTKQTSAGRISRSTVLPPETAPGSSAPRLRPTAIATAAPSAATSSSCDAPAAGLVVTRECHSGQDERHADHRAEERGQRPRGEQRVDEDRPGRLSGGARDDGDDHAPGGHAEQRSGECHRSDLGGEREPCLPAPRAPRKQPSALGGQPAAQADRGDDREAEQERAGRAADEHQPARGDPAAAVGVEQLVVGTGEVERRVGRLQAVLPARLGGQGARDVPRMQAVGPERGEPRVDPVERMEGRQVLHRLDARREQQRRRGRETFGRGRDVAEQVRVAQLRDADRLQPDVAFGERLCGAADLEHLAAGRSARAREAAALQPDDLGKPVDGGDLDEVAGDPQLPEEDDAPDLSGRERPEHAPHGLVLARVGAVCERRPEAVDAEAALVVGKAREPAVERLLSGDETAADDRDRHRKRERHAGDDERGPERLRAQPGGRDSDCCAC